MEEDLLSLPPETKFYKEGMIFAVAFFGGPLGGAYMIAENFRTMGRPGKAVLTWVISVLYLPLMVGGTYLIPGLNKVPSAAYAIIYPVCAGLFVRNYQGPALKAHLESGGYFYSGWRAFAICLIGLGTIVAVALALVAASGGLGTI